jgi:spore germination protein KB
MPDQPIKGRQSAAALVMTAFGSSAVLGVSSGVAQDSWISLILGALIAVPALIIYARLIRLHPGANLFEMFAKAMGRVAGKIATALMAWYALHLCALVMRNFSEFLHITSLFATPQQAVLALFLVVSGLLARGGGNALGKWSVIIFPIVMSMVAITIVMSLNIFNYSFIFPIFAHPVSDIARTGFQVFSFPFAETVLFLGIADQLEPRENPYSIYLWSNLISAAVLLLITFRNLFALGSIVMQTSYFPSYMAARIITIGDFISRIEGSISINFILAGITKAALCLMVASRGIAHLIGIADWRSLVYPCGFLALALALTMYADTMQMYAFVLYYPYYALLFQAVLPLLAWAFSEVRARRGKPAQAV